MVVILLLSRFSAAQLRDRTEHKPADQQQSQTQSKKPAKRGPRAIAVVEFLPGGGARLVPIALWINDRFYDASLYGANPEPMALQPETLYQATNYGEPTGWFTVTTPKQVNGNWVADGQWKPQKGSLDTKIAEQAAKQAKKKSPSLMSDDSGPPVLRRSPSSGSAEANDSQSSTPASGGSSTSASGGNPPPQADDDPDRPTLKNSSPPASTASSQPTLADNTPQASASPAPVSSPDDNDPDRPVLHRGKPAVQPSTTAAATAAPKPSASKAASPAADAHPLKASANAPKPPQLGRAYPAISDAGNYEARSLLYAMTPAEKEDKAQPMLALATEEVQNYVGKHAVATPAKTPAKASAKVPARQQNFVITDYDLRAFDLDFSNSPTFVLTAKLPSPTAKQAASGEFDYFVTVVARLDINGQAQKIFSSVTDRNHLDAFPRLEIIDAVDADANGRGDLLFRQHSDTGVSYALYRVYPYQMVKVFEGGAGM